MEVMGKLSPDFHKRKTKILNESQYTTWIFHHKKCGQTVLNS